MTNEEMQQHVANILSLYKRWGKNYDLGNYTPEQLLELFGAISEALENGSQEDREILAQLRTDLTAANRRAAALKAQNAKLKKANDKLRGKGSNEGSSSKAT